MMPCRPASDTLRSSVKPGGLEQDRYQQFQLEEVGRPDARKLIPVSVGGAGMRCARNRVLDLGGVSYKGDVQIGEEFAYTVVGGLCRGSVCDVKLSSYEVRGNGV